jgi:SAM-dependent methyltransferase
MTTQSARFVGSIPENYDSGLGPHVFFGYADDIARRVAQLEPASVLELAAGTGIVTRKLRDALGADCELLASDLNRPMLEVAQAKFGADESVRFEEVDATDLAFAEASFDVIVCQFGVMFFPDKARSYAEAHRVLKPGGHYVFNVWDSWQANPFAQITHEAVEALFPEDPPGFYKVPFGYHDADEIKDSLLAVGFDRVTVERVPLTSAIPVAANFAKGLVFGNPLFEEIVNRGGDPQQVCDLVADALEQQVGAEMSLQALVVQASRG